MVKGFKISPRSNSERFGFNKRRYSRPNNFFLSMRNTGFTVPIFPSWNSSSNSHRYIYYTAYGDEYSRFINEVSLNQISISTSDDNADSEIIEEENTNSETPEDTK